MTGMIWHHERSSNYEACICVLVLVNGNVEFVLVMIFIVCDVRVYNVSVPLLTPRDFVGCLYARCKVY